MATPLWLKRLHSTLTRRHTAGSSRKAAPCFRPGTALALERLEDRTAPAAVTILGSDLISAGGLLEYYQVPGFVAPGTGNRSVTLGPGTYSVQNNNGTYGTFTVSNQDTVAGTTGALVAADNSVDFNLTQLAAVTINAADLRTSPGGLGELTYVPGATNISFNDDTFYLPAGTYSVANLDAAYGFFTVAENGSCFFLVSSTTGALVATGNTIDFDLTQLAAVTIYAGDLRTSPGGLGELTFIPGVLPISFNDDTSYLPIGTYSIANESAAYGSFTVAENGSGSFLVSSTTGALVATGNTIDFDLTKLAPITIKASDLTTTGGLQEFAYIPGVVGFISNLPSAVDTVYLPAGTYSVANTVTAYGTFTVADNGSDSFVISSTTGALVANGNTIDFEGCALNNVTITPNPGVSWAVDGVANFSSAPDTVLLPDGSYTILFTGATGGAGPATFSVGAGGLSATQLPANAPLVYLTLTPCAPTLISAAHVSNGTTIAGTYMGRANTSYRLSFYGDMTASPSGLGLGETLLGSASVTTDASGNATLAASVAALPSGETVLSATATDPNGNTSTFSQVICLPPSALGTVCTVYTTADSGPGSLRQAILYADATGTAANPDEIAFCIPTTDPGYQSGTSAFTIQPLSALPTITDTVTIDGYTQPGASGNTLSIGDNAVLKIVLDGSLEGAVDGLVIDGGNSTVCGLVIDNFAEGSGISISGGANDLVMGNFIGTDVTGESAAPNNIGIYTAAPGITIGGTAPGDRNVISGNISAGIFYSSGPLIIEGNYIGTDKNGTSALSNYNGINDVAYSTIGGAGAGAGNLISGNISSGIVIGNQNLVAGNLIGTNATGTGVLGNITGIMVYGSNNTVGGMSAGSRNIISGNAYRGIDFEVGEYNLVEGNYIGTDITGTIGLGNLSSGITIGGSASYVTIGGATAGARNIISGNPGNGITIYSLEPFGNTIQGNYIGTDWSGKQIVGGGVWGIALDDGAYDNTIGGAAAGAGNVISGFGGGVFLNGVSNNVVQGNLIGTDYTGTIALGNLNTGIYIDGSNNTIGGIIPGAGNLIAYSGGVGRAYENGVDVVSGSGNNIRGNSIFSNFGRGILLNSANNANDNQAFPVINGSSYSAAGTMLTGALQSVPNGSFAIDFYANAGPDAGGFGEGQTYLGSTNVAADGNGDATFTATVAAPPAGQLYFTATATNLTTGDTSEFFTPGLNHLTFQPTITVTGGPFPYTGAPQPATVTVTGLDGASVSGSLSVTYNGSATVPTNAGTYAVVATFSSNDPNYTNATGSGTLTINKANAVINVTPYTTASAIYDASAYTATTTAMGVDVGGAALGTSFNLTGTTHTSAGTYNGDPWSFSGGTNYNNANGKVNDSIAQAYAAINVTGYTVTYDTNPHTATGTATGVGGVNLNSELNLSGTTHINVGSYPADPWTFTDVAGNYHNGSGTIDDTINSAPATQMVFNVPPTTGLAGFNLNSPGGVRVAVEDQYGDVLNGNSSTVAIAVSSGPSGGAFISGSVTSAAAQSGVANFTQLALNLSGTYTLKATDGSLKAATATVVIQPNTGILLLDPTGQSLNLSGNAILNVSNDRAVYVDSSNTAAGTLSGNASLTATELDLKGGLTTSGNAAVHGVVNKAVSVMADPLASLVPPAQPATQGSAGSYSGTLQPGTYVGGITVSGNNSVTLQPGVYYLSGGGLTVSGNATVTGTGVMLYIASVSSGASSVNLSGNSTVTLTPPTSGAYQGIGLFQARTSTAAISISGNAAFNTTGTEYAPGAAVTLSGNENDDNPTNSSLGSEWIVADLTLSGNAKFTISADANNRSANPNAFMVAGGPLNLDGPVAGLTMAQADAAVTTALGLWQAAGLDAGTLKALSQTKVSIVQLPAPYLGLAAPGVIYLDPNAEGYGWFSDDATIAAIPPGKIDLVTVVSHELGHLFGLMDSNGTALMASTLAADVRILPNAGDLLAPHMTLVAASVPAGASEAAGLRSGLDHLQQLSASVEAETGANKHFALAPALGTVTNIELNWLPLPAADPVATITVSTGPAQLQLAQDAVFEALAQSPSSNDFDAALTLEPGVSDGLTDSLAPGARTRWLIFQNSWC